MNRIGPLATAIAVVLLTTGCTAGPARVASGATTPPSPAASLLDGCVQPGDGTRIDLKEDAVTSAPAVVLGAGTRGVVLTPEHGDTICQWLPFGRRLAAQGYHVLIWDPATDPLAEIGYFTDALRKAGAKRVVLVGASNGANICTFAAARLRPPVDGLAWLSGEDVMIVQGQLGQPVDQVAGGVAVPVLFIAAEGDPLNSARTAAQLVRLVPAKQKKMLTIPGQDHGVAMLTGAQQAVVVPALLDFLSARTAP
jgi:pimeloyl-ACP methyl ester carboxylesterase